MQMQLNDAIDGNQLVWIGDTSNRVRLFRVMNVRLRLAKKRRINGYGDPTAKPENGKKKRYIDPYTNGKGISFMFWAVVWGQWSQRNPSNEQEIKNQPKAGILHAPICRLLKTIYLIQGNQIRSSCVIVPLFIQLVLLKTGFMKMVFLLLTDLHTHSI